MRICCNGRTNGPKSTEQQLAGPEQSAIKSATDAIAGAREGNEYDDDGLEHRVPSSRTIGLVHRYCSVNDRYSLNAVLLDSSSTVTESDEIRHGSAGMTDDRTHWCSIFGLRAARSNLCFGCRKHHFGVRTYMRSGLEHHCLGISLSIKLLDT